MKKKGSLRRISEETLHVIHEAALQEPREKREQLAEYLSEILDDKSPSIDTIKRLISAARNHPQSELDQPWDIGSCREIGITADMVPLLIKMHRIAEEVGIPFNMTVRQARWFAYLYPAVNAIDPVKSVAYVKSVLIFLLSSTLNETELKVLTRIPIERVLKNNEAPNDAQLEICTLILLSIFGLQYAKHEQIREMLGRKTRTSDLDQTYFIQNEIPLEALIDSLNTIFIPVSTLKEQIKMRDGFTSLPEIKLDELEKRHGIKLSEQQIIAINGIYKAYLSGFVSFRHYIKTHPVEWAEYKRFISEGQTNER